MAYDGVRDIDNQTLRNMAADGVTIMNAKWTGRGYVYSGARSPLDFITDDNEFINPSNDGYNKASKFKQRKKKPSLRRTQFTNGDTGKTEYGPLQKVENVSGAVFPIGWSGDIDEVAEFAQMDVGEVAMLWNRSVEDLRENMPHIRIT